MRHNSGHKDIQPCVFFTLYKKKLAGLTKSVDKSRYGERQEDRRGQLLCYCKRGVSAVHGPISAGVSKENNKRFR